MEERVGLLGELKAQERDLIAAKTAVSFFWFDLVVVVVVEETSFDMNVYIKHPNTCDVKDTLYKYISKLCKFVNIRT